MNDIFTCVMKCRPVIKICSLFPVMVVLTGFTAEPPYLGRWEGFSTATMGIMGAVDITRKQIRFGNSTGHGPACTAGYSAQENQENKNEITFTLRLHNKQCDLTKVHDLNRKFLSPINSFTLYLDKCPIISNDDCLYIRVPPEEGSDYIFFKYSEK